jgi:hypothetical protein
MHGQFVRHVQMIPEIFEFQIPLRMSQILSKPAKRHEPLFTFHFLLLTWSEAKPR